MPKPCSKALRSDLSGRRYPPKTRRVMVFVKNIGGLLKKASSLNPSLFQATRCMSSSELFTGGLLYNTDDQSLREAFTNFGQVFQYSREKLGIFSFQFFPVMKIRSINP